MRPLPQTLHEQDPEEIRKQMKQLDLMEAALYVSGRPLDLKTLASVVGTRSKKLTRRLASMLKQEYDNRRTSLEILELEGSRYVMQLKSTYSKQVKRLALRPLLTIGPLKTLSYIAYRQPVPQKQVLDVRGHHVYNHLRQLEDLGLITRLKEGRTKTLRTTEFFADYFGFSHELRIMKRQLKKVFDFEFQDREK